MLLMFGMALFVIGLVLIAAAYAYCRLPGASQRLQDWVRGETIGVVLTVLPATGLIAFFYFVVDPQSRNVSILHVVVAATIAVAGWYVSRTLIRFGTRLEAQEADAAPALHAPATASGPTFPSMPDRRAA